MTKEFACGMETGHYHADCVCVRCTDVRCCDAVDGVLPKGKIDFIIIPGASANMAGSSSEETRQTVATWVSKLLCLHHGEKVVLTTHSDCGALGGLAAFNNDEAKERAAHEDLLKAAKAYLQAHGVTVPIELYFIAQGKTFQID